MARAETVTLMPLDHFARTLLVNPAHFNTAMAPNARSGEGGMMVMADNSCSDIWWQHPWQEQDAASRETIAEQIAVAEEELAQVLRYWTAPRWMVAEAHTFDNGNFSSWQGRGATIRTNFGKIIAGGRRAVTLIGTADINDLTLAYSDTGVPTLNEFNNLATITLPTDVENVQEIKVYFTGHAGDEAWEVRPVRSKALTDGNVVITLDSWLLIDPDLWEQLPSGAGMRAIDISSDEMFVQTVEVYREYNDPTAASVVYAWRDPCGVCGGSGCGACGTTTQDGCLMVIDAEHGVVAPFAANYNAETGVWDAAACCTPGYGTGSLQLYYYAGDRDDRFLRGTTFEPMRQLWIKAISYMTTARLRGGLCACPRTSDLVDWLQEDVSRLSQGASYFTPGEMLLNPFGVLRGEVLAYKACRKAAVKGARVALV